MTGKKQWYATVTELCDICRHRCVAVVPVEFRYDEFGTECGECGNMSMYPVGDPVSLADGDFEKE